MDKEKVLRKIDKYISNMPSLPVTATKIMEIANMPNTSPADLNRVISLDPVLMGSVLKLINSAYYGLSQEITSLVRAIIMLGINTVKNLALSTSVLASFGNKKEDFHVLNMDGFWRHSLCVGVVSKMIARKMGVDVKNIEEYFIAGLLHDIGKIPLNNTLPEEYMQVITTSDRQNISLIKAEKGILPLSHTDVGKLIVENWKLSQNIKDVIVYHHSLDEYTGEHNRLLKTVALADYMANFMEIGFSGNRYPDKINPSILNNSDINWDYLEDLEDIVNGEIEKAKVFLTMSN